MTFYICSSFFWMWALWWWGLCMMSHPSCLFQFLAYARQYINISRSPGWIEFLAIMADLLLFADTFICVLFCLPSHQLIKVCIQPSICLAIYPLIHPFIHLPRHPPIHPSIHPPTHPSIHTPTLPLISPHKQFRQSNQMNSPEEQTIDKDFPSILLAFILY